MAADLTRDTEFDTERLGIDLRVAERQLREGQLPLGLAGEPIDVRERLFCNDGTRRLAERPASPMQIGRRRTMVHRVVRRLRARRRSPYRYQ